MSGTGRDTPAPALLGRERECARIDELLGDATAGTSGVLVIRGEAGIGKTALLDRAEVGAADWQVLRTAGHETESSLSFAGLHGLLRPLGGLLDELAEHQAAALAGALGLAEPPIAADRFAIAAATLSLLALAAERRPVLCLIDDAHWLDPASVQALSFAARRLRAEPVAMLFAARPGQGLAAATGGPEEMLLNGLDDASATGLLATSGAGAGPPAHAWLLATAAGNPLALLELPAGLTQGQLAGEEALPDSAALSHRLRRAFAERVESLDHPTRHALSIAALQDAGPLGVLRSAIAHAGLSARALDHAQRDGLITVGQAGAQFRHPLVRAAILELTTESERRGAHTALAQALADAGDEDRSVWHRARAALAPDAPVASAVAAAGGRAQVRGDHGLAATAFERAAELTADPAQALDWAAVAAHEAWEAGDPQRARGLVARTLPHCRGGDRARLLALRGVIEARTGDVRAAAEILLEAAEYSDSASLTLELLTEAAEASVYAGDYAQAAALGRRAASIPAESETDQFRADTLVGLGAAIGGDHERAAEFLSAAARRADALGDPRLLIWAARTATLAGTHGDGLRQASRAVAIARDRALLSLLPAALQEQSTAMLGRGRFVLAYALAEEAAGLTRDLGQRWGASWNLANLASLDALRGDESRAREHADGALALATAGGAAFIVGFAQRALALLDLTLGRPEAALDRLLPLVTPGAPSSNPLVALWSIPDAVEAAARASRLAEVQDAVSRYADWVRRAPSPSRRSMLARCQALAGIGDPRERFEAAVAEAGSLSDFQRGRTELHYGEWLRRAREPRAARAHLRTAAELFRQVGVAPWRERAESELRATGERPRRRDPSTIDELTPQELLIASLVATGLTNREIRRPALPQPPHDRLPPAQGVREAGGCVARRAHAPRLAGRRRPRLRRAPADASPTTDW